MFLSCTDGIWWILNAVCAKCKGLEVILAIFFFSKARDTSHQCVWPKNASLGRRGIISRHNLSRFSMGGFDIHSWLSGDAEPPLRALVFPPQLQSRGCFLGPSLVWWQQSENIAPPFLSSSLNSHSLVRENFSTGVLSRIFPY